VIATLLLSAISNRPASALGPCGSGCDPCEMCDSLQGCIAAPATGCLLSTDPRATRLHLRDDTPDLVEFIWKKGAATTKADFGNPVLQNGTDYQLCIYDQAGGMTSVLLSAAAPADGLCNATHPKPCWKESGHGFTYLDRDLTPDGLFKITLKEGLDGKAKITVKGKGDNLGITDARLHAVQTPVTAQVRSSAGVCWEATYDVID
jgi:hypothetical protein